MCKGFAVWWVMCISQCAAVGRWWRRRCIPWSVRRLWATVSMPALYTPFPRPLRGVVHGLCTGFSTGVGRIFLRVRSLRSLRSLGCLATLMTQMRVMGLKAFGKSAGGEKACKKKPLRPYGGLRGFGVVCRVFWGDSGAVARVSGGFRAGCRGCAGRMPLPAARVP